MNVKVMQNRDVNIRLLSAKAQVPISSGQTQCPPAGLVFHLLLLNTLCRLKAGNTLSAGRPRGLCPTGMKE